MRLTRIYQPVDLRAGLEIALDTQAATHLTRVLRLREGSPLIVFNGAGGEYAAVLSRVGKRDALISVGAFSGREAESALEIVLAQGVSRGERMDYTVQKAVELGVTRIVPVVTERSVVNLQGERADKRRAHWQSVAASACEQCGRNRVPVVDDLQDISAWLPSSGAGTKLLLYHQAAHSLAEVPRHAGPIQLLIGPEGGLSEAERAAAQGFGFTPVRFGPRVLRTETAALAALSVIQGLWGDLC